MKISAAQAYCILDTVGSSILTKSGEISVSYLLELPEAYSLDRSDLEERHNELFRAFQYVRTGFIHKQDVFLRRKFKPEYVIEGEGYIQTAERKYFDGREYLHHFCILSFTLSGLQSLEKAYQANPLAYSEKLAKADRDRLAEFLESVESAVSIIRNIRSTQIRPLDVAEVKQHLFRYVNGFHDDEGLRDIQCSDMIRIGQKKGVFFAVCDERYLPDRMKVHVTDSTLQEANSQLYMSMLERIGVHVPCSHVVNQIWKFAGGSYREELAERVKLFGRYREFDKAIKIRYDGLASYEQEIINEENVLCKTHLNVLLLEDDETILNRQTEQVKMIFTNAGFKYYIPSYEGLYNIFIGSIIGRENNLNPDYLFLSDLHSSLCMGINYSTFRSDKEGILFNERLYQTPIRKDVWDADKKRIPARNMIIVASTGGGKSVTSLNIIQQNIEQNYKQIVVEFGKSFYQLSQLYPDRSLHIDYDGSSPLGINPFYTAGKQPDNEKIKTLVNLVLKFWRSKAIMEDTKQVVSLTKIICRYYEDIPDGHCFPDFYRYVQREGKKLYERLNILPEYFDIDSFLHVCSEFMPGGFYENVCKPSPLENDMQNRDFSVTLKSIDGNTAVVGKPVNCTLTISDLDPDNGDQILTRFEIRDGDGVILVDNNEYSPGETFEYDFKANNRLDFDFIPATEGEAYIVMGVASELVTRSDSVKLKVSSPEINIRFQNVPDLMKVSEEAEFYLQLDTELYGVKASARFVKGSGRVYISGYDATRGEGVALEKNNLVTFRPDATGQAVIEFTVSSKYGLPVKENVTIQVNQ